MKTLKNDLWEWIAAHQSDDGRTWDVHRRHEPDDTGWTNYAATARDYRPGERRRLYFGWSLRLGRFAQGSDLAVCQKQYPELLEAIRGVLLDQEELAAIEARE